MAALEAEGHGVLDLGAFSAAAADYPDYARVVGQAVARGFVDGGLLVCGSGAGAAMAANKLRGIRAAVCGDAEAARRSREEQDANVLCLTAQALDAHAAIEVVRAWVGARFRAEEPHVRRLAKISELEAGGGPPPDPRLDEPLPVAPLAASEAGVQALPRPLLEETPRAEAAPAPAMDLDVNGLPGLGEALDGLESRQFVKRAWAGDATLWTGPAEAVQSRLGWLTAAGSMRGQVDGLKGFADEIRRLGFSHVLVLGMGASSLSCDLFRLTFGSKMGYPDLLMLDSTDPAAVRRTLERVNVGRTLFVVSTRSGTPTETLAFYAFFRREVEARAAGRRPGQQFVAITGADAPLDQVADEAGFRRTFLNPPSIGGRYSALTFFGLVPAALTGVEVKGLLERALAMAEACGEGIGERDNAAVRLGAALAGLARAGRDKITLVLSREVRGLGPWIEQLLAESLGKDGRGVVPVVDEPLGPPEVYGADRAFVALTLAGDPGHDAALGALADAGHPVIRLRLRDPLDLGGEIFRWELATAAAGAALEVNPFDEPDIGRAKENAASLLAAWKRTRRLPAWPIAAHDGGVALVTGAPGHTASVTEGLAAHLAQARAGDYLAIQAYLAPSAEAWHALQALRLALRDRLRIATTLAFGPQYLHSTGQLHKGGPPSGLFLQVVCEDRDDLPIPGEGYGFGTLKAAQASGDLQALRDAGRRVIRLQLAGRPQQGLEHLGRLVDAAVGLL